MSEDPQPTSSVASDDPPAQPESEESPDGPTTSVSPDDDGFDDDDFGDFEEAAPTPAAPVADPDDPFNEAASPAPVPKADDTFDAFANFDEHKVEAPKPPEIPTTVEIPSVPSLKEIVDDETLWVTGDDTGGNELVEKDERVVDYFPAFDVGHYPPDEGIQLDDKFLNSLKLWKDICFIEDTHALQFSYPKSQLYQNLLSSLHMNSAKAAAKPPVLRPTGSMPTMVAQPLAAIPLNLPSTSQPPATSSNDSPSSLSPPAVIIQTGGNNHDDGLDTVDSLSVPPVNFDWQSSGLSNPLTGAGDHASAMSTDFTSFLDYDFRGKATDVDGCAIEDELQKHGLGDLYPATNSSPKQTQVPADNAINLDEILRPGAATGRRTNGTTPANGVSQLSADAKSLLDALPDYGYMLSKILAFPVGR